MHAIKRNFVLFIVLSIFAEEHNHTVMDTKIQELTDLIYKEGVVKGNEEAERLISEAKSMAEQIIADAKKEAQSIISEAKKSSDEYSSNTQKELTLYSSQMVGALKSEIANVITDKLVKDSVKGFVQDKDLFNSFVLKMATKWVESEAVVISTADADSLKSYFAANAKDLLDKGIEIKQVNGQKTQFSISPADGSYKVNFGEEEFVNFFKSFLRPQLVESLF